MLAQGGSRDRVGSLEVGWTGAQGLAHHRTGFLSSRCFLETGAIVHAFGAEPHKIRMASLGFVDWIGFDQRGAARARA
jgi:hypothetical protein